MIFQQFYLDCLAQASHLVGDETTRTAAIIDPQRDVQVYLDEAERHGLQIRHVFLTIWRARRFISAPGRAPSTRLYR